MGILRRLLGSRADDTSPRSPSTARHRLDSEGDALQAGRDEIDALASAGRLAQALSAARARSVSVSHAVEYRAAEASILVKWGRMREAASVIDTLPAEAISPRLILDSGWVRLALGDLAAAEVAMRHAVEGSASRDHYYALGFVQHLAGNIAEAIGCLRRAIEIAPEDIRARVLWATCELIQGDPRAAEKLLREAVAIDRDQPSVWVNLGTALGRQNRHREAMDAYLVAERLERETGEQVGALTNLAICLSEQGRGSEAIHRLETDISLPKPYRQYIHGVLLLREGRLAEAWDRHEFRWACDPLCALRARLGIPEWNGQDLRGKVILLRAEQGIGDTIQFVRYAACLRALGATVHLRVQSGLERLARNFVGVDHVETIEEQRPADFYINLMSLPRVFGTAIESIPLDLPYVRLDPGAAGKWKRNVPATGNLRVGLVWAGNPEHQRDHQRSIALTTLAPLFDVRGVDFYALQKGSSGSQIASLERGHRLIDLAPQLTDFSETALALCALDLIISVDTAVAHLAGALARPTWTMLPDPADFRWMRERHDSPWYPTMRLFRQRERGDWGSVVQEMARALASVADGDESLGSPDPDAMQPTKRVQPTVRPWTDRAFGTVGLCEARYGLLEYFTNEPIVGPSIAHYGEYLQQHLMEVLRRLPTGSTVIEVGAGIGAHTVALAQQVGLAGHVLACETRRAHQQLLARNISCNQLRNVTVLPRTDHASGTIGETAGQLESVDDLQVESLTCLLVGRGSDALLTIRGAEATIWRLRPMIMAISPAAAAIEPLVDMISSFGYRCWTVETRLFDAENFNHWPDDVFGGSTEIALIGFPEESPIGVPTSWVAKA